MKELEIKFTDFIKQNPIQDCVNPFRLAYNHGQGWPRDLYESVLQRTEQNVSLVWRILGDIIATSIDITEFFLGTNLNSLFLIDDLEEHLVKYTDEISDGNRVIAVAHSQGNLYANEAHNLLYNPAIVPPGSFRIISVATPAGFVAGYEQGEELYTTLQGDLIHLFPDALDWNIPDTDCGSSWECHAFVKSYLNRSASRSQIMEHIVDAITAPIELETGPREGDVFYLSFNEGNPGVPGDGVTISPAQFFHFNEPRPQFSLSDTIGGLTITAFPVGTTGFGQDPNSHIGIYVLACIDLFAFSLPISGSTFSATQVNGVTGYYVNAPQQFLDHLAEDFTCPLVDWVITRFSFGVLDPEVGIRATAVDAVAVGFGQDVLPTEDTPPPE